MVSKSTANTRAKAEREKAKEQYRVTRPCVWCGAHLSTPQETLGHTPQVCANKQKQKEKNAAKGKRKSGN